MATWTDEGFKTKGQEKGSVLQESHNYVQSIEQLSPAAVFYNPKGQEKGSVLQESHNYVQSIEQLSPAAVFYNPK
ncbi:unnamed protein product, partial [Ilex paraguariensis]